MKEEAVEKLRYDPWVQQDLSLCTQWSKDGSAPMMQWHKLPPKLELFMFGVCSQLI